MTGSGPSRTRLLLLLAGALAVAGLGYALGQRQQAEARARLERSNRELRASFAALEEGLREARTPLQRRIHELETALAEVAPPQALAEHLAELESLVGSLRQESLSLDRERHALAASRRSLLARLAERAERPYSLPGPLPAVASGPPLSRGPALSGSLGPPLWRIPGDCERAPGVWRDPCR